VDTQDQLDTLRARVTVLEVTLALWQVVVLVLLATRL